MEILSYPIGILLGLFPVLVDLGPSRLAAYLIDLACGRLLAGTLGAGVFAIPIP